LYTPKLSFTFVCIVPN